MPDDLRAGIALEAVPDKLDLVFDLRRGSVVDALVRAGGAVQAANAAYADLARVLAPDMRADLALGPSHLHRAIATDDPMVSDLSPAPRPVHRVDVLGGEVLV